MRKPDDRADPALSDRLIAAAPPAIKALFDEFEFYLVVQALERYGLNAPPNLFSPEQVSSGAANARRLLEAHREQEQAAYRAREIERQEFVDAAPASVRKLFQEYGYGEVLQALAAQGVSQVFQDYTESQIEEASEGARKILEIEMRGRLAVGLNDAS